MRYMPDEWELVFLDTEEKHYRIFASWYGGFSIGDSWKLNSGITNVQDNGDFFIFFGESGSEYWCSKKRYGINSSYNTSVLQSLIKNADFNITRYTKTPDIMEIFK